MIIPVPTPRKKIAQTFIFVPFFSSLTPLQNFDVRRRGTFFFSFDSFFALAYFCFCFNEGVGGLLAILTGRRGEGGYWNFLLGTAKGESEKEAVAKEDSIIVSSIELQMWVGWARERKEGKNEVAFFPLPVPQIPSRTILYVVGKCLCAFFLLFPLPPPPPPWRSMTKPPSLSGQKGEIFLSSSSSVLCASELLSN